jgi:NAD(P)-dependent dehydrogenase (short-subunit alcohol dehydrogenase family)
VTAPPCAPARAGYTSAMKIIVIGATGTIGAAVVRALRPRHEVVEASRKGPHEVDIQDARTLAALFDRERPDAVISAAGGAAWKPIAELTDADFESSLHDKLMGQVNVIRAALTRVRDSGAIVVTSGVLAQQPMQNSGAVSLVNAGLEGFVRVAALEAPRGIRVNVVSPPWLSETLKAMGQDPKRGLPADTVAKAYVAAIEGTMTGETIRPG